MKTNAASTAAHGRVVTQASMICPKVLHLV